MWVSSLTSKGLLSVLIDVTLLIPGRYEVKVWARGSGRFGGSLTAPFIIFGIIKLWQFHGRYEVKV